MEKRLSIYYNQIGKDSIINGKYAVVNNTYEPLSTTIYRGDGSSFNLEMNPNEIIWYQI